MVNTFLSHWYNQNKKNTIGDGGSTALKLLTVLTRVAELGSLSLGAKMAMRIFVKRVFTIFATNASFLRIILQI